MDTAILDGTCRACGWPVVDAICGNSDSAEWGPTWDYWMYCTNKGCENHAGEGYEQETPAWWINPRLVRGLTPREYTAEINQALKAQGIDWCEAVPTKDGASLKIGLPPGVGIGAAVDGL